MVPCALLYQLLPESEVFFMPSMVWWSSWVECKEILLPYTQRKPSHATTKYDTNILLLSAKNEWNTKEDTGKYTKSALYILWYAKRHFSSWSDVIQWKNLVHTLSHCWVMLVWWHQAVSYSITKKFRKKLNSVATFWKHFGSIDSLFGLIFT